MTAIDVQNYWDARPCNVFHSDAKVGSAEYYHQVRTKKFTVEPHIIQFAQFPSWAGKRVLEIGCGIGIASIEFARYGADVTAVDLSPRSLQIAAQNANVAGSDIRRRIDFRQADAESLSSVLDPEPYDLIYSFGVLHHTPHPRIAFQELTCFASPGTVFKLMMYHRFSTKAFALTGGKVWRDDLIARQSEAQSDCPITYAYTRGELRDQLSPWWRVEKAWIDHIFPYRIGPYTRGQYVRKPWADMPGFTVLEHVLGWHLLVNARLS